MDNETPQYAKWLPQANGYVSNGTVISSTPQYDSSGKFLEEIGMPNVSGTATQQPTSTTTNTTNTTQSTQRMAETVDGATWIPEAGGYVKDDKVVSTTPVYGSMENAAGSGEDKNSAITNAGSLASLNNNTANSEYGVLNTPATTSNIANTPVVSPLEQAQKDYEYMVATNNYKGMIDALTRIGNITGQDYSAEIQNLTRQRNQKIMNQDDAYLQAIDNALAMGDTAKAQQLQNERMAYRDSVGYQEALNTEYNMKVEDLNVEYKSALLDGVNDIANMVVQMLPSLINFQYDPNQDTALQRAQAYTRAKMSEQAIGTGMYYSSMVQGAIASAVAELVPVYEKMARDEIKENLSILQSTANFLLNIEETQFNMWKGQLQMKFQANEERRKEVADAWDRANMLGYVDNQASAVLGVPAGTLSPKERERQQSILDEIDKEDRTLANQMALAKYKNTLDMQQAQNKAYLDYIYDSQLKKEQHSYDMALQRLKNQNKTSSSTPTNRTVNNLTGLPSDIKEILNDLVTNTHTNSQKTKLLGDAKYTANIVEPGSINENDALIDSFHNMNAIEAARNINSTILKTYLEEGVYPEIDALAENFGSDYNKTDQALKDILTLADTEANNIIKAEYNNPEKIAALYKHVVDLIEGTADFDYSWWNLDDNFTELQNKAEDEIVERIKNNKSFGDDAGRIAEEVDTYIKGLQADKKPVLREGLVTNTYRKGKDLLGKAVNTTADAAGNVINSDWFNKGSETISNAVTPFGGAGGAFYNIANNISNALSK